MTLIALPAQTPEDLELLKHHAPEVKHRAFIEVLVCRRLLQHLVAAGYFITVDDGDSRPIKDSQDVSAILPHIFAVDECRLFVHKAGGKERGWVYIVLGNDGWDAICDYTTNLNLDAVNEYCEQLSEHC